MEIEWTPIKSKVSDKHLCKDWAMMSGIAFETAQSYRRMAVEPVIMYSDNVDEEANGDFSYWTMVCRIKPGRGLIPTLITTIHELGHYLDYYINGVFDPKNYLRNERKAWEYGGLMMVNRPQMVSDFPELPQAYHEHTINNMAFLERRATEIKKLNICKTLPTKSVSLPNSDKALKAQNYRTKPQ